MANEKRFPDFDRSKFIPLFDGNAVRRFLGIEEVGEPGSVDLIRIGKSTIFTYSPNAQTETQAFIETANDYTYIKNYAPTMPQEVMIDGNDPAYALMYEFTMHHPTGSDAEIPNYLAAPSVTTPGEMDMFAWPTAMMVPGDLSPVDKKLNFTINYNGEMERGTGERDETTGKFKFVPKADEGTAAAAFSARSKKAASE